PPAGQLAERTEAALARRPAGRAPALIAPEEVDEIRIVHSWIAAHDPPRLSLDDAPPPARLRDFVASVT
ncbi:MAG: hypothetical protein QOF37_1054, partial [Thermoleophilaceae bacterium]|nr:hypothetical protein [Thermoleophilaceae bacterium]